MIQVEELTLQYPRRKRNSGVSFQVEEGQVIGYLGPNGAGKATTIRCLLGFSRPDGGRCSIGGLDCWRQAPNIQRLLGYLPGEVAFLDGMTGRQFLKFLSRMRETRGAARQKETALPIKPHWESSKIPARRDNSRRAGFLCLWANTRSRSVKPGPAAQGQ